MLLCAPFGSQKIQPLMKAHKEDRRADHDFIKQLDQLQNLIMKNFRLRGIGLSPFEHLGDFLVTKFIEVAAGQHLDFGAVGVNSSGGELGRGSGVADLNAALVAAGLDAV